MWRFLALMSWILLTRCSVPACGFLTADTETLAHMIRPSLQR